MPPVALPNLYTTPNDLYDYLGSEGAQLRADDHRLATGQIIQATADAALGATALQVMPLSSPLLNGSVLVFDGGGMAAALEVTLTAVGKVGDHALTVAALGAVVNATAAARDSGVNLATALRLLRGCQWGTAQVKLWCCSSYDDSQLATCWSANRWATVLGGKYVCQRGGQSAPASVKEDCEQALRELKWVKMGALRIEDIGTRTASWPSFSNTRVDVRYDVARVRVQPMLSEPTPTQYGQYIDWDSVFSFDLFF